MLSLNKLRPVSAELIETGCMMALHYCADHLGDPDRKRWKREGLAERGGGGGAVGRTATRGKGVCDYVGKSLLPEQARTRTHHAIYSPRKNACAIVAQVNIRKTQRI